MTRNQARARAIERCRERAVLIPTFQQMRDPHSLPATLREALAQVPMQAVHPLNLFRITWRNDVETGGFGDVNIVELPSELTGVPARIVGLVGKHFPTGAHKVGAAFGCLVPRLVSGGLDPTRQRAIWPSTGNYCRGGAFDSALLGCRAVAILPEEMSPERFEWLESIGAEVMATPGCESNVKEIFDACQALKRENPEDVVFNQFEELGNYLWHRTVTGPAVAQAFEQVRRGNDRFAGWVSATGSAGTLGAGDHLKQVHPGSTITAAEALQCPTLLCCGYGGHRVEGIGDKHVPWIHNVRNTDLVTAIDDRAVLAVMRLFNEPAGREHLASLGLDEHTLDSLPLLGISSICNLLAAIKTARYYELGEDDVIFTVFTDSMELYGSRLRRLNHDHGPYSTVRAAVDLESRLWGCTTDHLRELRYTDRKAIHHLKYFTWVEQQGRDVKELDALWSPTYWQDLTEQLPQWDQAIDAFNQETGVFDTHYGVRTGTEFAQ